MRRWLLVLLLFVLPLQFAWAGAAGYCQHEQEAKTWHLGHHSHEHADGQGATAKASQAVPDSDSDGDAAAPLGLDHGDCSVCHLGCAKPFANAMPDCTLDLRQHFASPAPPRPAALGADRIDRPNWFRVG
jgi:hypothetical protein